MGALKDIGSRWIFGTWSRGTPSVIGFHLSYNGHGLLELGVGVCWVEPEHCFFLSYRGHFPLGPYVERLGEGVPNLAWNLYFQASALAEGDPRQRVRINVGVIFRIGGVEGNGDGIKEDFTCLPRYLGPSILNLLTNVIVSPIRDILVHDN